MRRRLGLYAFAISIPLLLALNAWQSNRYAVLAAEVRRLEAQQREWLESNKRLIAGIAVLSSSERIERIAREELGLSKKRPEEILQIRLAGGRNSDG